MTDAGKNDGTAWFNVLGAEEYWDGLLYLLVIMLLLLAMWRVNKAPANLETRMRRLELIYTLWGAVIPLVVFAVLRNLKTFDNRVNFILEMSVVLCSATSFYVITKLVIGYFMFSLPRQAKFRLSNLWWDFVRGYGYMTDDTRLLADAKLLIFLSENNGDEITIRATFSQYLIVLCAATCFAQREWFATHTVPTSEWPIIAQHAGKYFDALAKTYLRRRRVLVRPAAEIETLGPDDRIVQDTKRAGAKLYCMPPELLKGTSKVEDYAIFDDDLAIVGGDLLGLAVDAIKPATFDPNTYEMDVKILRGKKAEPYKYWRDALKKVPPLRKF